VYFRLETRLRSQCLRLSCAIYSAKRRSCFLVPNHHRWKMTKSECVRRACVWCVCVCVCVCLCVCVRGVIGVNDACVVVKVKAAVASV